eukprot:394279-Alexandrium_andersonii.AAC.1
MSASLVGSEMCIRDRGGGRSSAGAPARLPPARLHRQLYRLPSSVPRGSCLLYTSDAADDM